MPTTGSSTKTIIASGDFERIERKAGGAITPGHLVELNTSDNAVVHASAGQSAEKMFAVENDLEGEDITDAYASGERVQIALCHRGCVVNALLADGENVVVGDPLESNGDGTLRKHDQEASANLYEYLDAIVAYAAEALDMSDSTGADPSTARFLVRVA